MFNELPLILMHSLLNLSRLLRTFQLNAIDFSIISNRLFVDRIDFS